jgi:hypothetical protein
MCLLKSDLELDPEPDPDPLVRDSDPGIRIRTKMSRIPTLAQTLKAKIGSYSIHFGLSAN